MIPQTPVDERVVIDSVEWLFQPDWPGPRFIARCRSEVALLTDATGAAVDDPGFAEALVRSLAAESAMLDGVWTARGSVDDEGQIEPAFVAIDLLELDGASLLDVPFQERRRLLESVLRERPTVRLGPIVKQPLDGWFTGWREAGFTHYLARHQNAHYHPGTQADTWLRIPIEAPGATPGFLQHVVGSRRGRGRRIRD